MIWTKPAGCAGLLQGPCTRFQFPPNQSFAGDTSIQDFACLLATSPVSQTINCAMPARRSGVGGPGLAFETSATHSYINLRNRLLEELKCVHQCVVNAPSGGYRNHEPRSEDQDRRCLVFSCDHG